MSNERGHAGWPETLLIISNSSTIMLTKQVIATFETLPNLLMYSISEMLRSCAGATSISVAGVGKSTLEGRGV